MARDRRPDDEFDDEDDRPRKKPRDDREEEWQDEDDRPRKSATKGGLSTGLLLGLLGGLVAVAGVVAALVYLLGGAGSPRKAFEGLVTAAENKDWGAVYDGIEKKSLDMVMPLLTLFSAMDASLQGKTGKDLFVALMAKSSEDKKGDGMIPTSFKMTVVSEKVDGDRATLQVKDDKGVEKPLVMVKEDGRWKLSLASMMPAGGLMGGMPKFDMPDMKMPKFDMPDFKMPKGEFPELKTPKLK